jgi:hypothetical protein
VDSSENQAAGKMHQVHQVRIKIQQMRRPHRLCDRVVDKLSALLVSASDSQGVKHSMPLHHSGIEAQRVSTIGV